MIKIRGNAAIDGSMFTSLNSSWPLGSLSIEAEQLCVNALLRKVVIRKDTISRIRLVRVLFWREYRFELRDGLKPAYITFGCWNLPRVLVALEEYGWQVDLLAGAKQPRRNH